MRTTSWTRVKHLGDGRWLDEEAGFWRDGKGRRLPRTMKVDVAGVLITRVVLATAHLDHDPGNSRPRNLKALCQRCHMLNDRPEHVRRRRLTYLARRALGDLFLGPYRLG